MKNYLFALSAATAVMLSACGSNTAKVSETMREPYITVKNGSLQGVKDDSILVFKGIPYAQPPVGENRWRAPQPVSNWQGIKDATDYGNDCAQKPFPSDAAPLGKEPAEDCLYANVWAPQKEEGKHPVVVWIHGGGYINGGASPATYDGSEFARAGVVFVSFNYRLGRFGFFAHPALSAANEGPLGNYGYQDQIAAMKWVQENIEAFGGDKNQVTVMGESAGGGSVHNLLQTPSAQGTFHRAIIMSGGGRTLAGKRYLDKGTNTHPSLEQIGINFAEKHGIKGTDEKALTALRSLPADDIVDGFNLMDLFSPKKDGELPTFGGPVNDGEIVLGDPQTMMKQGQVAKVPVMVGATSQDIGFASYPDKEALFASFGKFAEDAKQAYDPTGKADLKTLITNVAQDRYMQEPSRFVAQQMTRMGQNAYLYRYDYVAENIRDGQGALHASEIPFFFKTENVKYPDATQQDRAAADLVFHYVVNFIKNGDPNRPDQPEWKPYDDKQDNIMMFTMNATALHEQDPWVKRLNAVQKATEAN
ncbi:carboxylesterase family protein [Marinomonas sp. CT5]|uniref:carboxylesterase/lipase family protein n=1 Tax=Marinomonas sp. CT5 TaxID=2066133 RepID=UPI001BAF5333|nr:carboxylesterase family protein [Marinomonas sp. CT5]